MINDRHITFENEWLAIRDSGELPEIAFHSSIYYLTEDLSGPRLRLSEQEKTELLEAAKWRFQDIILRDMRPENKGKSFYRGIRRSMENWQRFKMFHRRHNVGLASLQKAAAGALRSFLAAEINGGTLPSHSVNCSYQELLSFACELGLSRRELPENLEKYFNLDRG